MSVFILMLTFQALGLTGLGALQNQLLQQGLTANDLATMLTAQAQVQAQAQAQAQAQVQAASVNTGLNLGNNDLSSSVLGNSSLGNNVLGGNNSLSSGPLSGNFLYFFYGRFNCIYLYVVICEMPLIYFSIWF